MPGSQGTPSSPQSSQASLRALPSTRAGALVAKNSLQAAVLSNRRSSSCTSWWRVLLTRALVSGLLSSASHIMVSWRRYRYD